MAGIWRRWRGSEGIGSAETEPRCVGSTDNAKGGELMDVVLHWWCLLTQGTGKKGMIQPSWKR